MLLKLFIENYALIQKLEIDWSDGFTVITGETGAGKSILVGALSLILGQRADTTVLFSKEMKCIVEGTFNISGYGLESYFLEQELDYEEAALILRREILPSGKSRAFINDTPVNLNQLKEVGDRLVNIHSQHSITTLSQANFQLEILDDYASVQSETRAFRKQFNAQKKREEDLSRLNLQEKQLRGESDYLHFLFDELDNAFLVEGEQQDLEGKLALLTHAEEIKNGITHATYLLEGSEENLLKLHGETLTALKNISRFYLEISRIVDRLETNLIDMKDITTELQHLEDSIQVDPQESERISTRLDLIYRLQKKHLVGSVEELISVKNELSGNLLETESLEERIALLRKEIEQEAVELDKLAEIISIARQRSIPDFEKEISGLLVELGMPAAKFSIHCERLKRMTIDGIDSVKFLFSANQGVLPDELSKIASGGELSRLMLSIKSMINRKNLLPTVIFDEIDSGVSGEIAGKVGTILKRMADNMQVIVITHLPQIAGKGSAHYWAYKEEINGITRSKFRKLSDTERVEEIAKMLSSERFSEAAYQTARELLIN
ncbi:MAG: DNA repair protein RecN [Bacteroidales bacterium]|nr:DNA repair protein RecN [Bacteroidales bacterium]